MALKQLRDLRRRVYPKSKVKRWGDLALFPVESSSKKENLKCNDTIRFLPFLKSLNADAVLNKNKQMDMGWDLKNSFPQIVNHVWVESGDMEGLKISLPFMLSEENAPPKYGSKPKR